jgi:hypothetical protein
MLSALVVGSMAPDMPYFLELVSGDHRAHTLLGVLVYCLPAGLAILWVFHFLLKVPLLSLLPATHQERLSRFDGRFAFGPTRRFLMIVLSLLIGVLTHIVWDEFTHSYGWIVRHFGVLGYTIHGPAHTQVKLYKVLQHGSTLLGGALLLVWYVNWFRQAPKRPIDSARTLTARMRITVILILASIASIAGVASGVVGVLSMPAARAFPLFVERCLITGISAGAIAVAVFCILWHLVIRGNLGGQSARTAH